MTPQKLIPAVLGALLLALGPVQAGTIKKCKDEAGRWHYGDNAASECAHSKVIEMSTSGRVKNVIDAPPSASDLETFRNKKLADERAKEEEKQAKMRDKLLLSQYATEQDIVLARDRQIRSLDDSIASHKQTLTHLEAALQRAEKAVEEEKASGKLSDETMRNAETTRNQVERHKANLKQKEDERDKLRDRFDQDLARYRELKHPKIDEAAAPAPAAPAAPAPAKP